MSPLPEPSMHTLSDINKKPVRALLLMVLSAVLLGSTAGGFCDGPEYPTEVWFEILRDPSLEPRRPPQWTPSGEHIVFTSPIDKSIHLVHADRSVDRLIATFGGRYDNDLSPDISPDGTRIVYSTSRHRTRFQYKMPAEGTIAEVTRNLEIETSRLDGSDRRRLTENEDLDGSPTWSPDGTMIAFVKRDAERFGGVVDTGLYIMESGGSNTRRVARYPVTEGFDPEDYRYAGSRTGVEGGLRWSPDGQRFAFAYNELYEDFSNRPTGELGVRKVLYAMNVDGTGMKRLFPPAGSPNGEVFIGGPAWSPDSSEIVFVYGDNQQLRLYAFDVQNFAGRTLTSVDVPSLDASIKWLSSVEWSPNGAKILFTIGSKTNLGSIYVVNSDGSNPRNVWEGTYASWSPDGSRIAVFNHLPSDSRTPFVLIYTLAADGTDFQAVVQWD